VDDGLEHTRSNLLAELMSATILAQDSPTVSAKLGTAALRGRSASVVAGEEADRKEPAAIEAAEEGGRGSACLWT
jgi:hypothetical protein